MAWYFGRSSISTKSEGQGANSLMHIVLVEPEIPPNTGNIARLCAAPRTKLHLIEPFGFKLDDRQLKRAGMDYWQQVQWRRWSNWAGFAEGLAGGGAVWLVGSNGARLFSQVKYSGGEQLAFWRGSAGPTGKML